jgi:hypothetical protein
LIAVNRVRSSGSEGGAGEGVCCRCCCCCMVWRNELIALVKCSHSFVCERMLTVDLAFSSSTSSHTLPRFARRAYLCHSVCLEIDIYLISPTNHPASLSLSHSHSHSHSLTLSLHGIQVPRVWQDSLFCWAQHIRGTRLPQTLLDCTTKTRNKHLQQRVKNSGCVDFFPQKEDG